LKKVVKKLERFRLALFKNHPSLEFPTISTTLILSPSFDTTLLCFHQYNSLASLSIFLCLRWPSHRAQPISCLDDPIKTTTFILAFYSRDDSWKVLDENVRIFNSLFQGYSN